MKKIYIGVGLLFPIIIGYLFASPYLVFHQMEKALKNKDGGELTKYIDFPSLRQNLKDQLNIIMATKMTAEINDNSLNTSGAALGGGMVDKMIDENITPSAITELMREARPDIDPANFSSSNSNAVSSPFEDASMAYESLNKFSITKQNRKKDIEIKFILRRRGIGWKLTEIALPSSIFDRFQAGVGQKTESNSKSAVFLKPIPDNASIDGKFINNTKEGELFIITGRVKNQSNTPVSFIKVQGTLETKHGLKLKKKTVFCGNTILNDFQKHGDIDTINKQLMKPNGINDANINIKANATVPFMIVFSNLPEDFENYTVKVETFNQASDIEN